MAYFRYGISYEIAKRRDEFFALSFDEMVGKIIELEQDLDEATEKQADLQEKIDELEASQ